MQEGSLPKLSVTKLFYKRLLWPYVFNFHIHNDDTPYFCTFLESCAKKGPNSVAFFVFDAAVNKKINENQNIKQVLMISDATEGQNENKVMMMFSSWLSSALSVRVVQMFPVRGHRNFSVFKSSLKKREEIELPEVYHSFLKQVKKLKL